jgi:HK97 family phage major capsid protein
MSKRLRQMQDRAAAIVKEQGAINDKAAGDNRLELNEEEQKSYDALSAEFDKLAIAIEREKATADRTARLGSVSDDEPAPVGSIVDKKPSWQEDDCKGFKTPREFFSAIVPATESGHTTDERLLFLSGNRNKYQATVGSDEAGGYSDPYGGFLIPTGFVPNLLSRPSDGDPTAGRTTMVPMATPKVEIPARTDHDHSSSVSGGLIVYRRHEAGTVTAPRMQLEMVSLSANSLMGLSYATEELMTDSAISFTALLSRGFQDAFSDRLIREKIRGTGVGEMEGVLNTPALVSVSAQTGQATDTILWENVRDMRARCWGYQRAIWLYNQDALPQLISMVMPVGTSGVAMWQTSAREGEPDMLFGRPAFASEYCSTIGDAGDLILCDWSQYLEGVKQGVQSDESMHVRYIYNERTFRFTMRNDGRCWWRAALTPAQSSITLSPVVVLEAR